MSSYTETGRNFGQKLISVGERLNSFANQDIERSRVNRGMATVAVAEFGLGFFLVGESMYALYLSQTIKDISLDASEYLRSYEGARIGLTGMTLLFAALASGAVASKFFNFGEFVKDNYSNEPIRVSTHIVPLAGRTLQFVGHNINF